ncbi:hypothetical protein ACFVSW_21515 [Neobacillus sp. NPDC058068]|uniref:hypothetical protein n=1 Tax=Neobacillus sp. NPDC058068 TaxID=3346325 RepID=UPI0036DD2369
MKGFADQIDRKSMIESVEVDNKAPKPEDTVTVRVKFAELTEEIKNVEVFYTSDDTYRYGTLGSYDRTTNMYTGTLKGSEAATKGNWRITEIAIRTTESAYSIYNSNISTDQNAVDLSGGDFRLDPELYKPVFTSLKADKQNVKVGESVQLTLTGTNYKGESKLSMDVYYRSPSAQIVKRSFSNQTGSIVVDLQTEKGLWQVDHLTITDAFRNSRTIYHSSFYQNQQDTANLSSGNFTVAVQTGWVQSQGKTYYIDPATGQPVKGMQKIEGKIYFFDEDGVWIAGWVEHNGKEYYAYANGTIAYGWKYIDNEWYYFTPADGTLVYDWKYINGKWYFFDEDGAMVTGFIYYNDLIYLLKNDGSMATSWQSIEGYWYYFNGSGELQSGWLFWKNNWYYLDDEEFNMVTGLQVVNRKLYYFDSSGVMKKGWQLVKGHWYFFNNSGDAVTGWKQIGGKWYHFSEKDGTMQTGWQYLNLNYQIYNAPPNHQSWYYFNASGAMTTGWLFYKGSWYYLDQYGMMTVGTRWIDRTRYYFKSSGAMAANEWVQLGPRNDWYYYLGSGKSAYGWQVIKGKRYYFDSNGVLK